jgi:hypothetical protein
MHRLKPAIDFQYFPVQDKKVTAFIIAIDRDN